MPAFTYVGHSGETIVGMKPEDLTEEDYDALDYNHQQAVLINKGSDGGPLYQEVHEAEPVAVLDGEPVTVTVDVPVEGPGAPAADDSGRIPPTTDEPDLNQPLDVAPAEGAN